MPDRGTQEDAELLAVKEKKNKKKNSEVGKRGGVGVGGSCSGIIVDNSGGGLLSSITWECVVE